MRIYLDNDVVSALARHDMGSRTEQAAIDQLQERAERAGHHLVTSEASLREFAKTADTQARRAISQAYERIPKVEFLEDHELLGFATLFDQYGGFVTNPLLQDQPTARQLWEMGLDRPDAHHLLVAITRACDVFLTCDGGILARGAELHTTFGLQVLKPSELVRAESDRSRRS